MRLIYHPDAEAELVEAAQFYEGRVSTLGAEFLDAVDLAIHHIQEAPVSWRIVEAEVRIYRMRRFPYSIYYHVSSEQIRILAFKHHSVIRTTGGTVSPDSLLRTPSTGRALTISRS